MRYLGEGSRLYEILKDTFLSRGSVIEFLWNQSGSTPWNLFGESILNLSFYWIILTLDAIESFYYWIAKSALWRWKFKTIIED